MDLLEELAKATENKAPANEPQTVSSATAAPTADANDFWGADEPGAPADIKTPIVEPAAPSQPATSNQQPTTVAPTKVITQASAELSARTTVGTIDLLQSMFFRAKVSKNFDKKFTEEEKESLIDIEDKEETQLKAKEKELKIKWVRLNRKKEKTLEAIPFNPTEEEDLQKVWAEYYKMKGIEIPPEGLMITATLMIVGKRYIELVD